MKGSKKSATKTARPPQLLPGGVIGNKGGTGRPPDAFTAKCKEIVDRYELVEYLADVSSGKEVETVQVDGRGTVCKAPASTKDRLRAVEMLLDRAYGKPTQQIESDSVREFMAEFRLRHPE